MRFVMVNDFFKQITRLLLLFSLTNCLFSQALDSQEIAYNELKNVVELASRSQQTVWVEDFTGLE